MKLYLAAVALAFLANTTASSRSSDTRNLKTKKKKSQKSEKKKNDTGSLDSSLVAVVTPFGDDAPDGRGYGTVAIRYNRNSENYAGSNQFLVSLDLKGLDFTGEVMIAEQTSCDHNAADFTPANPEWDEAHWYQTLGSSPDRISQDGFRFTDGDSLDDNRGRAVVVFTKDGFDRCLNPDNIVSCGILSDDLENEPSPLVASMGSYPGYDGGLVVSGLVSVAYYPDNSFKFSFELSGLEADCSTCGIHIHAGTSCATDEDVKGHGWNDATIADMWTADGGAFYDSSAEGTASGFFHMKNGFTLYQNNHHAVVVHAQDGTRIGCGQLMS